MHFFGWKPSPPDFRDHIYTAPPRLTLPDKVDLVDPQLPSPFEPAWNQGQLGSCGPNSAAKDIVFAALRQQNFTTASMPSRLFIYYCARQLMGTINEDSGVYNRALLKALAQFGWCDESLWPYDLGKFRQKPLDSCYQAASKRKISQYLSVRQDLDQMRGCLASGDPFIFGFSVYESIRSNDVTRSGDLPMPDTSEKQIGGHDVLIVGYDDSSRRFKFANSWGPNWGKSGYGTIPYEYAVNPRLAGDFWTVRHSAVDPDPPEPPEPTPAPGTRTIVIVGASKILVDGKEI